MLCEWFECACVYSYWHFVGFDGCQCPLAIYPQRPVCAGVVQCVGFGVDDGKREVDAVGVHLTFTAKFVFVLTERVHQAVAHFVEYR